ncbi:fungal-specific transcription factor domain-containing protein [Aspergillus varians]
MSIKVNSILPHGPVPTQPPERKRNGCTECKRKKAKCDLKLPVCSRCTKFPRQCKYEPLFIAVKNFHKSDARREGQRQRQRQHQRHTSSPHKSPEVQQREQQLAAIQTVQTIPSPSAVQVRLSMRAVLAETTAVIFPLASRPFLDGLVSAAMKTPHLLYALLAGSDSHARRRNAPAGTSDATALKFTNDAIAGLRAALAGGRDARHSSVEMAMTAMALCTNDVCNGNLDLFRVHLEGVRGMLEAWVVDAAGGGDGGSDNQGSGSQGVHGLFAVYLFKWFAALDVSARLSLFHKSSLLNDRLYQCCQTVFDLSAQGDDGFVDDICGYSLCLLPILAEIGELARMRYEQSNRRGSTVRLSPEHVEITARAEGIEARIRALPQPTVSTEGSQLAVGELQLSHTAFIYTALLHLHGRVQLRPKDHPAVRTDVHNILDAVSKVPPFSATNILLLWPIFSAGCETDDGVERAAVDGRMANMQSIGMGNFTRARDVLKRFWGSGTDLRWDVYLAGLGVDLVLF